MNLILVESVKEINDLGIPAVKVEYYGTNYVSIYVDSYNEVDRSRKLCKKNSSKLIKFITNEIKRNNPPEDFDDYKWTYHCVSNVYSIEEQILTELIYKMKDVFIKEVNNQIPKEDQPEHIFAHSAQEGEHPGYNILYPSKEKLKELSGNHKNKIRQICENALSKERGFDSKKIKLKFSYTEDPAMDGVYRED